MDTHFSNDCDSENSGGRVGTRVGMNEESYNNNYDKDNSDRNSTLS